VVSVIAGGLRDGGQKTAGLVTAARAWAGSGWSSALVYYPLTAGARSGLSESRRARGNTDRSG